MLSTELWKDKSKYFLVVSNKPFLTVDYNSPDGDRGIFIGNGRKPQSAYLFTTGLKHLGGGYIKYNADKAEYIGTKIKWWIILD